MAQSLPSAAFDIFLVRKLGVPDREELAFGAISTGPADYWPYLFAATLYCVLYSAVAMLLALLMFALATTIVLLSIPLIRLKR